MKHPTVNKLHQNNKYFEEIYKNVWLMDDHKWAYYIWEKFKYQNSAKMPPVVVHLDYHWDGINDFRNSTDVRNLIKINNLETIHNLVEKDKFIRKDSFIAPAIIRGIINEVHFYRLQFDTERGLDEPFLSKFKAKQYIHNDIYALVDAVSQKPIVFDIDLDLFNRSDMWEEGNLWKEQEMLRFLETCSLSIRNSSLITIAMSYCYSGTKDDTIYLTKTVVPKLIAHFGK